MQKFGNLAQATGYLTAFGCLEIVGRHDIQISRGRLVTHLDILTWYGTVT